MSDEPARKNALHVVAKKANATSVNDLTDAESSQQDCWSVRVALALLFGLEAPRHQLEIRRPPQSL